MEKVTGRCVVKVVGCGGGLGMVCGVCGVDIGTAVLQAGIMSQGFG